VMSVPDHAMPIFYKLILGWQAAQLKELQDGLSSGTLHPNEAKMRLAREIVSIFYSPADADAAQKRWDEVFRSGSKNAVPEDIPEEVLREPKKVLDILRDLKMVASGQEAKNLMKGGGIRFNGEAIEDPQMVINLDMLPAVLQVGKRKFMRLVNRQ
jgi:tyrosyl-tRNA synthetase